MRKDHVIMVVAHVVVLYHVSYSAIHVIDFPRRSNEAKGIFDELLLNNLKSLILVLL